MIVAIAVAQIPNYARVIRAQTFVVRRAGYVEQAVTLRPVPAAITAAARAAQRARARSRCWPRSGSARPSSAASGLSFLGMGPQPPAAEWGAMLSEARNYLRVAWWEALFPGIAITLTVVCLTVVGRRLQRRFEGRTP